MDDISPEGRITHKTTTLIRWIYLDNRLHDGIKPNNAILRLLQNCIGRKDHNKESLRTYCVTVQQVKKLSELFIGSYTEITLNLLFFLIISAFGS